MTPNRKNAKKVQQQEYLHLFPCSFNFGIGKRFLCITLYNIDVNASVSVSFTSCLFYNIFHGDKKMEMGLYT